MSVEQIAVAALASAVGAELSSALPSNEVEAFRIEADGRMTVFLAGGERVITADRNQTEIIRRVVAPKMVRPPEPLQLYVRRRLAVAPGETGLVYVEAGR